MERGLLWPDPLIQLNPSFMPGATIEELVERKALHPECAKIFRRKSNPGDFGLSLRLHKHQDDAIHIAAKGRNYVLTTGTGSGKSLSYIIPIVNQILHDGPGKGIRAIIVYPMNALANSQCNELEKFLRFGYPDGHGPVTFKRYTGQETDEERELIVSHPPDIILTNYVMLELILTRPFEKKLIEAAQGLRFLVLDELHTYRGRQGADVAMLVRRVRDALNAVNLQHVGTSATMASGGGYEEQRREVSAIASKIFGAPVQPEDVITETLRRTTEAKDFSNPAELANLKDSILRLDQLDSLSYEEFIRHLLACWIESEFGLTTDEKSGLLARMKPKSIEGEHGASLTLANATGLSPEQCFAAITRALMEGFQCLHPETGFPVFAFRLHQFISRGDTVYTSLESESARHVTLHGQIFAPEVKDGKKRVLLPMAFCRECGQEYYCVKSKQGPQDAQRTFSPRELSDRFKDDFSEAGYLFFSGDDPWPSDPDEVQRRVPDHWLEEGATGLRVKPSQRQYLPEHIRVSPEGAEDPAGLEMVYLRAPFRFCLKCGVAYQTRTSSDITKLSMLGEGGRSTATTILTLSAIGDLRKDEGLKAEARKLLSFTDNRQDASLQAGHFNDFIEIVLLRSALFRAAEQAGAQGLSYDELTAKVYQSLGLPFDLYAQNPEERFAPKTETERTFRDVLGYRIYRDLMRGWRISLPNLEQCGLLDIQYLSLDEVCEAQDIWQSLHPALASASPQTRMQLAKVLLDWMRRALAIDVEFLKQEYQERLQQRSNQKLKEPWALDEQEKHEHASILFPRSQREGDYQGYVFLSNRSGFGQYLRRKGTISDLSQPLTTQDTAQVIKDLLQALENGGLVARVVEPGKQEDSPGYQMKASVIRWHAGDGTHPIHDPIRVPRQAEEGMKTNPYFVALYQGDKRHLHGLQAHEHTAQVPDELRRQREDAFKTARLPILFCSPTMELGVDIAELNVVNMRNIPPTPANYAQRSGRAGRSGQPALVFSYCTTGSPHDQYFFRRPEQMVSGVVQAPRIDLANEDLIRSHIHAVWLAETKLRLGSSLKDILDLNGDNPSLRLLDSVKSDVDNKFAAQNALTRGQRILRSVQEDLAKVDWYSEGWLDEVIAQVGRNFDLACERWRGLYRSARRQAESQQKIILDHAATPEARKEATRLRAEAESQLKLLLEIGNVIQSDFYSYRYFASEGFLPGYSFPRLPLSAYIPGRKRRNGKDEFLSRPRFLAISEFGPRSMLYHEGSRYIIHKVILPVEEEGLFNTSVKLCPTCGYLHPVTSGPGYDCCDRCKEQLGGSLSNMFRLQNVATRRRDRISSDEDERLRMGYEIRTGIRFADHGGRSYPLIAELVSDEEKLATLTYGHSATLWRINLGWNRRVNKQDFGFVLDTDRGYWAKNELMDDDDDDPMSPSRRKVVPYVDDRRNCLLFEPAFAFDIKHMASIQAALKSAIQAVFQLEDNELAAEPLPDTKQRRLILFYEAAEGGAGVLRQLHDDPAILKSVFREALRICHFDPDTFQDLGHAPRSRENCMAACYDCLMSYTNQGDHEALDRKLIRDYLIQMLNGNLKTSPKDMPRARHLEQLLAKCESELERKWLRLLEERNLHLPDHAQHYVETCKTRPDFFYATDGGQVAIYVDGPPHDFPDRQQRDAQLTASMENHGIMVSRFHHQDDWLKKIGEAPSIFGRIS
ncbi:MAG: DEAD/DEAH box helicase [Candidatus Sumerlaeota bacterium]|nr:DEAD/DEAH box helicase [Candidatus Sumerlaeota bacterium]